MTPAVESPESRGVDCTVAIDLGGSSAKVAYCAREGELAGAQVLPLETVRAGGSTAEGVARLAAELVRTPPPGLNPRSVGLAVPGIVDDVTGVARMSFMLGWRDVPLRSLVADECALPTVLGHDVGVGALAEGRLGAARGHTDWLFLALGTGLGSALVLGGRPYRGSAGWGGELGHVVVDSAGPRCRCGKRGCLEMIASASGLLERYADAGGTPGVSAETLADLAQHGDAIAGAVWRGAVEALATVVAGVVETLNPSIVVVGGGLAESGPHLLVPLARRVAEQVRFVRPAPSLVRAQLGRSAGVHGAALLGLSALPAPADPGRSALAGAPGGA